MYVPVDTCQSVYVNVQNVLFFYLFVCSFVSLSFANTERLSWTELLGYYEQLVQWTAPFLSVLAPPPAPVGPASLPRWPHPSRISVCSVCIVAVAAGSRHHPVSVGPLYNISLFVSLWELDQNVLCTLHAITHQRCLKGPALIFFFFFYSILFYFHFYQVPMSQASRSWPVGMLADGRSNPTTTHTPHRSQRTIRSCMGPVWPECQKIPSFQILHQSAQKNK